MFGGGGGARGDHHAAGYLGPKSLDKIVSAVADPDDDDDDEADDDPALDGSKRDNGMSRLFGGAWENPEGVERIEGAFSALTPSMWPENTERKGGGLLTGAHFLLLTQYLKYDTIFKVPKFLLYAYAVCQLPVYPTPE